MKAPLFFVSFEVYLSSLSSLFITHGAPELKCAYSSTRHNNPKLMSDNKQRSKGSRPTSLISRCSVKLSDLGKRIKNRASIKTVPMFQGCFNGRQSVPIDVGPPVDARKYEAIRKGNDSGYYMLSGAIGTGFICSQL